VEAAHCWVQTHLCIHIVLSWKKRKKKIAPPYCPGAST